MIHLGVPALNKPAEIGNLKPRPNSTTSATAALFVHELHLFFRFNNLQFNELGAEYIPTPSLCSTVSGAIYLKLLKINNLVDFYLKWAPPVRYALMAMPSTAA